ncbi:hypothetical protein LTR85_000881 [Meristemomyces frigidus]|nr:hypothetical protein LTR85_000881 [Meristemomyces frigidus]
MPGNIISITPADIATWPTPNYVNPVERTWMPEYACILYAVSTVMVATRLWLRSNKKAGGLGLDDALLVGAWLGSTMFTTVVNIAAVKWDLGRHIWDVPSSSYEKIAEATWLAELSFLITGGCTKISVLLFYRRLVDGSYNRIWKWLVVGAIVFTAAWSLAFILTLVFNCNPTEAYWKAFNTNYHHSYTCVDTTAINLLAGIFAAISDLYSVVLPCVMTRHFAVSRPQKVALNVIFSLGILVAAASAVRTYYLYEVGQKSDVSWLIYDVFVWAQLEVSVAIICASAPALRVLFRTYLSAPFSRARNATRSIASRQSNRNSGLSGIVIRRISGPDDQFQRDDFSAKHSTKPSGDSTVSEREVDADSPSSTAASTHYIIKSLADYEAYNLQNMEKYRQSLSLPGRPDSRGRGTQSFSQPFSKGWHGAEEI